MTQESLQNMRYKERCPYNKLDYCKNLYTGVTVLTVIFIKTLQYQWFAGNQ